MLSEFAFFIRGIYNQAMTYPTQIKTPRLILSRYEPGDETEMHAAKKETWDGLTKTFHWASFGLDFEADKKYVQKCHDDFKACTDFHFIAREQDTGHAISYNGIHPIPEDRSYQFGLWVRQGAQGNGYAPEIINGLIRFAFDELGAKKIVGCHIPSNKASLKLFNKIGMQFEETRPLSLQIGNGIVSDAHWYSMTSKDQLPEMDMYFS